MVILDTSVIIDHLRLHDRKQTYLSHLIETVSREQLAVSVISIQELFRGMSTKNPDKLKVLVTLLASLNILPYTFEIAQRAGEIGRDLLQVIEFADAAIAATAIIHNAKLVTLNQKDFAEIPNLELYGLAANSS